MTSITKKQPRIRAKNHIKESTGRKVFRIVNAVVLTALALICLLPFVNVIAISFSNSFYVDSNQVYFWPKGWTVNAYTYILTRASFWTSFRTSIIRVLLGGRPNALARSVFLEPGCLPLVLVTDGPLHAVYAAAGYRVGGVQLAETVLRQAKEGLR